MDTRRVKRPESRDLQITRSLPLQLQPITFTVGLFGRVSAWKAGNCHDTAWSRSAGSWLSWADPAFKRLSACGVWRSFRLNSLADQAHDKRAWQIVKSQMTASSLNLSSPPTKSSFLDPIAPARMESSTAASTSSPELATTCLATETEVR